MLREQYSLKVFEKREFRTSEPKREGGWRWVGI
jgi:hypothetical protein